MAKAKSNHTCLAVVTIDSPPKKDENYYLQVFLKRVQIIEKEKKVIKHIIDSIEISF